MSQPISDRDFVDIISALNDAALVTWIVNVEGDENGIVHDGEEEADSYMLADAGRETCLEDIMKHRDLYKMNLNKIPEWGTEMPKIASMKNYRKIITIRASKLNKKSQYEDERSDDYNAFEEEQVFQDQMRDRENEQTSENLFVNVYDVAQQYGGPEEGGWYYEAGEFLEGHPVNNMQEAEILKTKLEEKYKGEHTKPAGSINLVNPNDEISDDWEPTSQADDESHVYSEGEINVVIEDEPGHDFPIQRPHYE